MGKFKMVSLQSTAAAARLASVPCVSASEAAGPAPARLLVEADADPGVTSRILDLLSTIDRYPRRLHLDRDEFHLTLRIDLEPRPSRPIPIAARIRQIPGVRKVVETSFGLP